MKLPFVIWMLGYPCNYLMFLRGYRVGVKCTAFEMEQAPSVTYKKKITEGG